MIRSHLYVRKANSPVYQLPNEKGQPTRFLERGNWVGVLEQVGNWVKVVGVHCIGWIKLSALESRPNLDLHIHQTGNTVIEYLNA